MSLASVEKEQLCRLIPSVVGRADVETTTLKMVRQELEQRMGYPAGMLNGESDFLRARVAEEVGKLEEKCDPDDDNVIAVGTRVEESMQDAMGKGEKRSRDWIKDAAEIGQGKSDLPAKMRQKDIMTRADFMKEADKQEIEIFGKKVSVCPKKFSTGSVGFFASRKVTLPVCGNELILNANVNITVVGSKEWKD